MSKQPTTAQLWQLLQKQQARIAHLEQELHAADGASSKLTKTGDNGRSNGRLSRASLLKGAAAGVAGVLAAETVGAIDPKIAGAATRATSDTVSAGQFVAVAGPHITGFSTDVSGGFFENGAVLFARDLGVSAGSYSNNRGAPGAGTGVEGSTGSGDGVRGIASFANGTGVRGRAEGTTGVGVMGQGDAISGTGVLGEGYTGLHGHSQGGFAVYGESDSNSAVVGLIIHDGNDQPAVSGDTAGTGAGVKGSSSKGSAIVGEITNAGNGQAAVFGTTKGTSAGVWGDLDGAGYAGVLGRTFTEGRGVYGQAWTGTGEGVYGEVIPTNSGASGVHGSTNGTGPGVMGESKNGRGLHATSEHVESILGEITNPANNTAAILGITYGTNSAVWGDLRGKGFAGVLGRTLTNGRGVYGQAWTGTGEGVYGEVVPPTSVAAAVHGRTSGSGPGIHGESASGRGAVLSGGAAQLQLVPSAGSHPASGEAGDLVLDAQRRLWLCTAGGTKATWKQLGTGGGGTGGGPLVGESSDAATPGVKGNNSGTAGTGIEGVSSGVAGIGVDGIGTGSGNSIGVRGTTTVPGTGVTGRCLSGTTLISGTGVIGEAGGAGSVGVQGSALIGVMGIGGGLGAQSGRGGVFSGGAAAIQLQPNVQPLPASPQPGDLYVDGTDNLWFCKGGAWKQVVLK